MTNDGTQDPVPPPVLSDPLAGLVTGTRYEPEALRVRVTEPPMPDISAVREAMASVLGEDSELSLGAITPAADFFTDPAASPGGGTPAQAAPAADPPAQQAETVAQVPVAQVPTQAAGQAAPPPAKATVARLPRQVPAHGAVTRVPTQPAKIPAPRAGLVSGRALPPAVISGEKTRRIRLPSGFMRRPKPAPGVQIQSSAGSVTLIMVLLLVMIVLGFVALASLIDTITSVFD